MSYQVLARKWRPRSFEELVGQPHVAQTLLNALRSGRLPHALLFSGARGVGKTSTARIFAKSLRCPNADNFVPCSQCSTCEAIAYGSDVNVIEIDGASNNGVENIRELRDTVGFMPSSGKYKVYIIDEVHMLSTSAFNALLKTLEEPPPHVVFIFATTEAHKIPITILSRCQRFDFKRIPTRQIAEHLQKICKSEGIQAEPEALWTIARQAEGALRDSQSLLDQAITFCDGAITQEKVTQILGLTDRALLLDTLQALIERDVQRAMKIIDKLYSTGLESTIFAQDMLEQLRHLLIIKLNQSESASLVDLPETEVKMLAQLGSSLSEEDIHLLFDMALKGANDLARSQNPRVVLEMLLLRMTQAPRIISISRLLEQAGPLPKAPAGKTPPALTKNLSQHKAATAVATPESTNEQKSAKPPTAPLLFDPKADVLVNWHTLVGKIKSIQPSLGAKLDFVAALTMDENSLRLGTKDNLIQGQLSDKVNLLKLQSYIKTYWGKNVEVFLDAVKGDSPMSPKDLATQKEKQSQDDLMRAVEDHPIIKKTQSTFKTKFVSIKEQA